MRICVLHSSYATSDSPLKDLDDYFEDEDILPRLVGHEVTIVGLDKGSSARRVGELARGGFDVFLNLCDGSWDEDSAGFEVVQTLDRLDLPYTGADPIFYDPTREEMKRVCHYYGIATPRHVAVRTAADIELAAATLRFPVITKHHHGYSSVGITRASRAETHADLRREAARVLGEFGGVLVEEFIEGRELTVLVCENPDDPKRPVVFPPLEYAFPAGESFKHFDLKWRDYAGLRSFPCADAELCERVAGACSDFFLGMRGTGYGRVDLRVDAAGVPYILEINPNCGIFYPPQDPGSADLILLGTPGGYPRFVDLILRSAQRRVKGAARSWEVFRRGGRGYGIRARRPIPAGGLVETYEERAHVLVTRSHVERCWGERERDWFAAYAWPLTDEVWVMWSDDPMQWRPVNHSCDPNSWLDGLDLVARRDIRAGDEITMDYATFCHESMPAFACICGASSCRGRVSGLDVLSPAVEAFGPHLSDYVRRRRATT